ncbi:FAD-binding oxidoreductase [Micromonospora sp. NPDC049523]|uniref:FAD-binding oxidoreductase n=1 Tax=Micromonospora sp. NPDC049523 TaxID=3155921 RepID=UPI00343AE272
MGTSTAVERTTGGGIGQRLAEICGERFARPAGMADGVAGAPAAWVAAPGTAEAVGAVLRAAADRALSVVPRGAGTKLDWGAPPSRVDIVLDTGRLAGVWHHSGEDMVAEVGAGTPLRAVQAALARTGMRLPIDAPSAEATVGGVVAADETGPMRHRHGSPGDRLFGVSYVDATGVLHHAGGWAAGETAGHDLARLLCGSNGALGVLVSATLRVQPVPASRIWVTRQVRSPLEMYNLVRLIHGSWLSPAAIEIDLPREGPTGSRGSHPAGSALVAGSLAVLLEGGQADVGGRVARLVELLEGDSRVHTAAPSWWGRYPFTADDVALRIDVPSADLHAAVYALRDAAGTPIPVRGSAGLGVVYAALPGYLAPEQIASILSVVRRVLLARNGRCVVLSAPPRIRREIDFWGQLPTLPLLRRVKERFDPDHRLAPGRYTGGI